MPIYEYECQACGHRFEEWQKMSDEPIRTCPRCKKRKVEKLISHTSFQLKGGGWYSDLYASQKPGSSGSSESASSTSKSESASSTSKSESASSTSKSESASSAAKVESTSGTTSPTASGSKGLGKKGAPKAAA
jgi:putative FmdB family regulatory protein